MQTSKILITGSLGLIGSALERQLSILGVNVQGIDLRYPTNHPRYGSICDLDKLTRLAQGCTGIVHLAAVSRVITGEQHPDSCWDVNVSGTQTVLEVAKRSPSKPWIIYASSREVYGQQSQLSVNESALLLPCNIYARSKVAAEELINKYRRNGLQTAIMRFSNVYGSTGDHKDRVIPAFCKAAACGVSIRIDGGHNTFDFTHIDDVIDGIQKVINKLQQGCFELPAIHLTTGKGTNLLEAANLAKSASKFDIKFIDNPSRSFDVSTFYGDPMLAKSLLNWQAKTSINEGIVLLVRMFEYENIKNNTRVSSVI